MGKIKVIIADDHPTFRDGLGRLLEDSGGIEVVGKAENGEEAVNLSRTLNPEVAIIDMSMPKLNGIEATRLIKESSPDTAVLIVSAYHYQSYILTALQAGAAGYLTKDTPINELLSAVRLAKGGAGVFVRGVTSNILQRLVNSKGGKKGKGDLYPREIEVLKLTARGMRNKQIACTLNISNRTVQAHLGNIFTKLDVDSRTEAVLRALKDGWLEIYDLSN